MITPRVDSSDSIHGFIVGWIAALAKQVEQLWVVTPRAEPVPLPDNVRVYEVGRDYSKGESVFHALHNFHRVMWHLTHDEHVDGIFTHMFPMFAVLAAPYAKLGQIPLVMWYTHKNVSWQLRLAGKLADRIVTASRGSCRLNSNKIRVVGHGIDTEQFLPAPLARRPDQALTILSVGRISPAKNYEIIIEAVGRLVQQKRLPRLRLRLVGDAPNVEQGSYFEELKNQVVAKNLSEYVSFEGAIPYEQIVPIYQQADVFVSASQTGLDKAVLEAMACGLIPVVSLNEFAATLNEYAEVLMYEPGNVPALTSRLQNILLMSPGERKKLSGEARRLVKEKHDVNALVGRIVNLFEERLVNASGF